MNRHVKVKNNWSLSSGKNNSSQLHERLPARAFTMISASEPGFKGPDNLTTNRENDKNSCRRRKIQHNQEEDANSLRSGLYMYNGRESHLHSFFQAGS